MTNKEIMGICRMCGTEFDNAAEIYIHESNTGHKVRPARILRGRQR